MQKANVSLAVIKRLKDAVSRGEPVRSPYASTVSGRGVPMSSAVVAVSTDVTAVGDAGVRPPH
jgi:hypothetical protein